MDALTRSLAWSLLHSMWLGLIAALLAAIIISVTGKTKARLRYDLLGLVFMLFLAAMVTTFFIEYKNAQDISAIEEGGAFAATKTTEEFNKVTGGSVFNIIITWFNNNTTLCLLGWTFFFLIHFLKLVAGYAAVNRLRNYRTLPVATDWVMKLEELKSALGVHVSIGLHQSELIKVPVTLGFLRPVILVPVGMLANIPPEQAEAILLHELGHIRRKDYLVNILQHIAEAIFFFNPAIRWVSSLLRQERESCCDDIVVGVTGQKRNYLDALVSFHEYNQLQRGYALGISSRKQYLLNRVQRIVTNRNRKLFLFEKIALLTGLVLLTAFNISSQKKKVPGKVFHLPEVLMKNPRVTFFLTENKGQEKIFRAPGKRTITPARSSKINPDTIPARKNLRGNTDEKPAPVDGNKDMKVIDEKIKVLNEIQELKDKIGIKKESIGKKKEELTLKKGDEVAEKMLKNQIEKERDEIEEQRDILDKKREVLDKIREKESVKKNAPNLSEKIKNANEHKKAIRVQNLEIKKTGNWESQKEEDQKLNKDNNLEKHLEIKKEISTDNNKQVEKPSQRSANLFQNTKKGQLQTGYEPVILHKEKNTFSAQLKSETKTSIFKPKEQTITKKPPTLFKKKPPHSPTIKQSPESPAPKKQPITI